MARPRAGGKKPGAGHPSTRKTVREVGLKVKQDRLAKLITDDDVNEALKKIRELAQGVMVANADWDVRIKKALEKIDPLKLRLLQDLAEEMNFILIPRGCGIYREKPDRQAATYLVDQKHGMPMARQQISGSIGGSGMAVRIYMPEKAKR